jgi:chromosome segregation ATPase
MFGNAQEITSDLFRPEIWQGKPGGLAARGGSVATPGDQMRSSRREEVEVYKWDGEKKRMREWRSYSTGCRLAIGSNVVLGSENWAALEREYEGYRNEIRANLPIGKTLDNPVAQAASQLTDARSILAHLKKENQDLAGDLSRLERFIEDAEEKLDHAQKESARSTAQDALREATDLGRDVFKLESLGQQKSKAEKLAELSTRYQDLVATIEKEMKRREGFAQQVLVRYGESVGRLGEYGSSYISQALDALGEKELTRRAEVALDLLTQHVGEYGRTRRVQSEKWWDDFHTTFKDLAD